MSTSPNQEGFPDSVDPELIEAIDEIGASLEGAPDNPFLDFEHYYRSLAEMELPLDCVQTVVYCGNEQLDFVPYANSPFGPIYKVLLHEGGENVERLLVLQGSFVTLAPVELLTPAEISAVSLAMQQVCSTRGHSALRVIFDVAGLKRVSTPTIAENSYLIFLSVRKLSEDSEQDTVADLVSGYGNFSLEWTGTVITPGGQLERIAIGTNIAFSTERVTGVEVLWGDGSITTLEDARTAQNVDPPNEDG